MARIEDICERICKKCIICQQFKIDCHLSHPAFMHMITDLPVVNGQDSLLVMVDQGLTKGVILLPCAKTITAEQVATLLLDNFYKRFGLPDKIISD